MTPTYPATSAAALLLALSACSSADADETALLAHEAEAGLGRCSVQQPMTSPVFGHSRVQITPGQAEGDIGRYALVLSCVTDGPAAVTLGIALPNLTDSTPPAGEYVIRLPGQLPTDGASERTAWVEARVDPTAPVVYHAVSGTVVLEPLSEGRVTGSYYAALDREPSDNENAPANLVLGGSFAALRAP